MPKDFTAVVLMATGFSVVGHLSYSQTTKNQPAMFTVDQIKAAHSKVKSGADFPAYVQDLIQLGVRSYDTYVEDGHTDYYGEDGYKITSAPKYEALKVAEKSDAEKFKFNLKEHQQGKSDYLTFIHQCAEWGVYKWVVAMDGMTCTYYDKAGKELLVERIPD